MPEVRVWAPNAVRVRVTVSEPGGSIENPVVTTDLEPEREPEREPDHELGRGSVASGWWRADVADALPGRDYGFLLDDDAQVLPDPRSRWQPHGVHQPSRFYSDDFAWTDADWRGHDLPDSVIYELHIGTFTQTGTFDAAIERLDYLAELGVTHVELLPVNVYNHLGASGNYLPRFGPYFKTGRSTWGELVNLDGESAGPVREYIIGNALMWLSEFHVDALRLDAVHALHDSSEVHLLAELSTRVKTLSAEIGRPLVLIAESDLNDPIIFTDRAEGGYGLDGQWSDDVHHALHALLSGERQAYYADYGSLSALAKVLTRAFFHDVIRGSRSPGMLKVGAT